MMTADTASTGSGGSSNGSRARRYVSPKRSAGAAETRERILEAFVDQLSQPGADTLSPQAAAEQAGVSVRTVHVHFPNAASQVEALGEWFARHMHPHGIPGPAGPDDLPRYFFDLHSDALSSPLTRVLAYGTGRVWKEVRHQRRAMRQKAISEAIEAIGAPQDVAEDTVAVLLSLSGTEASWPMHDLSGLPLDRVPGAIAHAVELIVADLASQAARSASTADASTKS